MLLGRYFETKKLFSLPFKGYKIDKMVTAIQRKKIVCTMMEGKISVCTYGHCYICPLKWGVTYQITYLNT